MYILLLTTATQPNAGILSLMALRWLKNGDPRFFSLSVWISWIFVLVGSNSFCFSLSLGALCSLAYLMYWNSALNNLIFIIIINQYSLFLRSIYITYWKALSTSAAWVATSPPIWLDNCTKVVKGPWIRSSNPCTLMIKDQVLKNKHSGLDTIYTF